MLMSLLKSPAISPSLIPGFLIVFVLSELFFVMLNLSINALILLLTGLTSKSFPRSYPWCQKKQYFSKLVSSSSDNPRRLWQTVNKLLNRKSASPLPSSSAATLFANRFAHFFTDKISNLRLSLGNNSSCSSQHSPSAPVAPSDFSVLNLPPNRKCTRSYSIVLISSVILILSPTWLLKECASVIIPTITNIVNLSLSSDHFHPVLKKSVFLLFVRNPP